MVCPTHQSDQSPSGPEELPILSTPSLSVTTQLSLNWRAPKGTLLGLEIDLSDDEISEAGYSCESDKFDEEEQTMNTLTLTDCISVFSSESTDDSTAFEDMSFSSSSDETFGEDSTWEPE